MPNRKPSKCSSRILKWMIFTRMNWFSRINFTPFLSELAIKISWARRFSCERAHLCQNQAKLIPSIVVVVIIIILKEMEAQRGISNASDMLIICTATLSALCIKHSMTSSILFLLFLFLSGNILKHLQSIMNAWL